MINTDINHFQLSGVYAITDPDLLQGEKLISAVIHALDGGVSVIQYRDKKSSSIDRKRNAQSLASCCHDFGVPLIINDDIQLCKSVCAAGVHIGQSDTPLKIARSKLGCDAIIGVTCHDKLALALDAWENQATYIALGRFFSSTTKANAPACDISVIKQVKSQINCPVVAALILIRLIPLLMKALI